MRAEPERTDHRDVSQPVPVPVATERREPPLWCFLAVVLAMVVSVGLLIDSARSLSATYDEVAYLRIAAGWWRLGDQDEITRMGSPLTFWKLQQAPALWWLERSGRGELLDHAVRNQARLLPAVRVGAVWIWLVALGLTALWGRQLYGPRAMAFAAWLFALSPNLLAHGALVTMELPIVATTTGVLFLFWRFLNHGRALDFWAASVLAGLAFSCKSTAVLLPPILALVWWIDLGRAGKPGLGVSTWRVVRGMTGFVVVMLLVDATLTGFALMPLSQASGGSHPMVEARLSRWPWLARAVSEALEMPVPQDWVGFATQVHHQRSGGPSYLLGERRMTGWWSYYFLAMAAKVPVSFWLLAAVRATAGRPSGNEGDGAVARKEWMLAVVVGAFLAVTSAGSSRNYGVRYLLPISPLAIVWVSALAERRDWRRAIVWLGLFGQFCAVAAVHPNELTSFSPIVGGRPGGRHVLADSNLDWGQGLNALARLQRQRPALRDLTLYYFGDTDPRHYGVVGTCYVIDAGERHPGLPPRFTASTRYVAVSASLQWGPWGPPDYFHALEGIKPAFLTDDTTIAIYDTNAVFLKK